MRTVVAGGLPIGDGHPPRIMGVLNVSPESPYEPSIREAPDKAGSYIEELIEAGADIVDVGLSSANKRFRPRSASEELDRLEGAVEAIQRVQDEAVFSIETRYSEVAEAALEAGFDMVNDICGFADPRLPKVCEAHDAAVVKMAGPGDLERPGALEDVDEIYDSLAEHLTAKTIVDPAFGGWSEAKTLGDDRELFHRLREFRGLDRPILVSINRKNFLRSIADRSTDEALPVSLAATSMAVERGAHVVRTHDVAETRDAALVGHTFARQRLVDDDLGIGELDITTERELSRHVHKVTGESTASWASDTIPRVFELSGLSEAEQSRLERGSADEGVWMAGGGDSILLVGTAAQLRSLSETMTGSSSGLDQKFGRLVESL